MTRPDRTPDMAYALMTTPRKTPSPLYSRCSRSHNVGIITAKSVPVFNQNNNNEVFKINIFGTTVFCTTSFILKKLFILPEYKLSIIYTHEKFSNNIYTY